jgi:hypothetical protein
MTDKELEEQAKVGDLDRRLWSLEVHLYQVEQKLKTQAADALLHVKRAAAAEDRMADALERVANTLERLQAVGYECRDDGFVRQTGPRQYPRVPWGDHTHVMDTTGVCTVCGMPMTVVLP